MSSKISGMPAATPLDGSELVPVVQGGANKRTTAQDVADLFVPPVTGSGAATQVAVWDGTDSLTGDADLTYDASVLTVGGTTGGIVVPKTASTGIKVDTASPTFGFCDLLGHIIPRTGSATTPTFTAYQASIYQYSFGTSPGVTEVFSEYHMPHDLLPDSDTFVHTHWSTVAAPTGNVNWMFDVSYAKGYDQSVFEGTVGSAAPITVGVVQSSPTAFKHQIAEVQFAAADGLISPAAVNVSITSGAATLTAASALFTAADISRTVRVIGAGSAGGDLDTTISAFTSTTQVTLANNAGTTVSAQDAFRYRVLDRALLEVDGLVLVRTWRNSARAADTLDVAPFLHFVDVHYQSNGVLGTKTKNFPFYT